MTHIVVREACNCSRCGRSVLGSAQQIYHLIVCYECFHCFEKELHPELKKIVLNYFEPKQEEKKWPSISA